MRHVRLIWLPATVTARNTERVSTLLSEHDIRLADRKIKEEDRLLSLSASYLLDRYVGARETLPKNPFGKPETEGLCFNLSHSEGLTGLALAEVPVGLDLEREQEAEDALASYCLSREEAASGEPFFSLFVAKEALTKAEGSGLPDEIRAVPGLPLNGPVRYRETVYFRKTWRKEGYTVSLCLERSDDFAVEEEILYEL